MSNKIAFVNYDTNFELPKLKGSDKTIIRLSANTVKPIKVLCAHAGRPAIDDGEIRYVGVRELKRFLKNIGSFEENIRGFIVPVPEISGPIWNDRFARMLGEDCHAIVYELFDHEIEKSQLRSWYYETVGKYILRTYMIPLKKFAENIGKEIIFNLGKAEMQYDLMRKIITPDVLKKAGLSLAIHKECGNIEKELGFSNKDFVISGDFLAKVEKDDGAKILLIKPTRGVMERFVQGEIRNKPNRLETPALLAAIESTYYSDMLIENGYSFDVTDERRLPKVDDLRKYENVLICKSCLFTEKETKKIDKLQKYGIKINDEKLICDLMEKGEDQWER